MLRLIVLITGLTLVPNVFAADANVRLGEPDEILILCERRLENKYVARREAALLEKVFERPFIGWIVHEMTPLGIKKMGFNPNTKERELRDLVLVAERSRDWRSIVIKLNRYRNGTFQPVQEYGFFNPQLLGYEVIRVGPNHGALEYSELTREYPMKSERNLRRIGYRSGPDQDGVRRYASIIESLGTGDRVSTIVEFGIDVPFDKASLYSPDIGEVTDDLRADSGRYVRIGALSFARVD